MKLPAKSKGKPVIFEVCYDGFPETLSCVSGLAFPSVVPGSDHTEIIF